MPTDPQNDYLPVPVVFGAGPYDGYVNNNFDKLTQSRIVSGPIADRPNPGAWAPQRYYAEDEDREYLNTGLSWRLIDTVYYPTDSTGAAIQSAIDTAAATNGVVQLDPSVAYTTTTEIHLKPGVTLQCNNAPLSVAVDDNGIFCDNNTQVLNCNIDVTASSYASSIIVLDSGRTDGSYGAGGNQNKQVWVSGDIRGAQDNGVGIHCLANNGFGIALGNKFNCNIAKCGHGILLEDIDGFINSVQWFVDITQCKIAVEGVGTTRNTFYGSIQPFSGYSATAIKNDGAGNHALNWRGIIWDAPKFTEGDVLVGPYINVWTPVGANAIASNANGSDGSPHQTGFGFQDGRMRFYDFGAGQQWTWGVQNGRLEFANPTQDTFIEYDPLGVVSFTEHAHPRVPIRDITTESPRTGGELCIATAASSPHGHFSLCYARNSDTWVALDGTEVTPP